MSVRELDPDSDRTVDVLDVDVSDDDEDNEGESFEELPVMDDVSGREGRLRKLSTVLTTGTI